MSICLNSASHLSLETKGNNGWSHHVSIIRAEEAVSSSSPHGDNIALRLHSTSQTTTLFVSLDPYDMDPGTFEVADAVKTVRVCTLESKRFDSGVVSANGVTKSIGLGDLADSGLASKSTIEPDLPETK